MSEFRVQKLMRPRLADNPDAWATIAEYPALEIAESRLRAWFQDDKNPTAMDPAYDPSRWVIEEWKDEELVAVWRLMSDFELISDAMFTGAFD
jgi:hypothetical protein